MKKSTKKKLTYALIIVAGVILWAVSVLLNFFISSLEVYNIPTIIVLLTVMAVAFAKKKLSDKPDNAL